PAGLERVTYLVEVCDPCEADNFAYSVNRIRLSDFLTPHFYDPEGSTGGRFSFRGNIPGPHQVLPGGYVSFGDPISNEWFQIRFSAAQPEPVSLGIRQTSKSLREAIDAAVRRDRRGYRTQPPLAAAAAAAAVAGTVRSSAARAESLRRS